MPATEEPEFTFEEIEIDEGHPAFEIGTPTGIILFCRAGEGVTVFPTGSALLMEMLGGDQVKGVGSIVLDDLWENLSSHELYYPDFVHWLHPSDYEAAVSLFENAGS